MSANYIGAFGRVNIGQFDVKRFAQNGCVETNQSPRNYAIVVNTESAGPYGARKSIVIVAKTRACKRKLLGTSPHSLPEAAGLTRANRLSFAVKMHHQKGDIGRRYSAHTTGLR
jgi:hypothetical protein